MISKQSQYQKGSSDIRILVLVMLEFTPVEEATVKRQLQRIFMLKVCSDLKNSHCGMSFYESTMQSFTVVEASRVATVSVLGGSTQWFESGKPANVVCAATGSELVDRVQWVKVDGAIPDSAEEKEQGILHFSTFTVSIFFL